VPGQSLRQWLCDAFVAEFNLTTGNKATKIVYPDDDKQDYLAIKAKIPAGVTAVSIVGYVGDKLVDLQGLDRLQRKMPVGNGTFPKA